MSFNPIRIIYAIKNWWNEIMDDAFERSLTMKEERDEMIRRALGKKDRDSDKSTDS